MSEDRDLDHLVKTKQYDKAIKIIHEFWVSNLVAITQLSQPELKELSYINCTVDIGDGKYVLALMHTAGKKIQLKEI